ADGMRWRYSPEAVFFFHGLGVAGQYFHQEQWLRAAPLAAIPINVHANGYYVLVTWLLTGEERTTYSKAVAPLRPFNPREPLASPGAWEVVVRVSRLDLDDSVFTAGPSRLANPALMSNGASELTLGFNWYLNK